MGIDSTDVISEELIYNYFSSLVNCFFKILPIRESEEKSLPVYLESLKAELLGVNNLIEAINNDAGFLTLLAILQHFIDTPQYPVQKVKREVFKAINICNRLRQQYGKNGEEVE